MNDDEQHQHLIRGANAELVVRRVPDNELVLDLRAVTVDGKRYIMDTEDVVEGGSQKDGVGEKNVPGNFSAAAR